MIAAERQRQIAVKGYDREHDDRHDNGELAAAAACYAAPERIYIFENDRRAIGFIDPWPWPQGEGCNDSRPESLEACDASDDERIVMLAKAGALCAAEIDRIQRAIALRGRAEQ